MKQIWSEEAYSLLYKSIVKRFGPQASWPSRDFPENKEEYIEYCTNFAATVGAKSFKAVLNQVAWATTMQEKVDNSHIRTFLNNKSAAIGAGFIGREHLPTLFLCEYK